MGVRYWRPLLLLFCGLFPGILRATQLEVALADSATGAPLPGAHVVVGRRVAAADSLGVARFSLAPGQYQVRVSHVGYRPAARQIRLDSASLRISFRLASVSLEMPAVEQSARRETVSPGAIELSVAQLKTFPGPSPDPLRLVKVLPGVSAPDDFSSAYNVWGGNLAENLIYIDGVELELPVQVRRGLAEGLSPVNPDLVERLRFQGGDFPVRWGDKLSSLLAAEYRIPEKAFAGGFTLSPMHQRLFAEGRRGRLYWISGARRADWGGLTSAAQVRGQYQPRYWDWQAALGMDLPDGSRLSAFGALLNGDFLLEPGRVRLRYNCMIAGCDAFQGTGEGREGFTYQTRVLGLRWQEQGLLLSAQLQQQEEDEDTALRYELLWTPFMAEQATIPTLQVENAESHFSGWRLDLAGEGNLGAWSVGGGVRLADLNASAYHFEQVEAGDWHYLVEEGQEQAEQRDYSGHLYAQRQWKVGAGELGGGMRLARYQATDQFLALPRLSLNLPLTVRLRLLAAAGAYAQPPLHREFLGARHLRAQRAYQGSAGLEYALSTQSTWRGEVFYRRFDDLISYTLDDLRLTYSGRNDATGYAWGVNTHLRGQVSQVVGIFSYGYLVAREDLAGDGRGYLPRPTDQRHTFSAYVEDHMRLRWGRFLKTSRLYLAAYYGSGFPYTPKLRPAGEGPALVDGLRHSRRDRGYYRVDMGLAQSLELRGLRVELRQEVGNIFDDFNVVGHTYLLTPDGVPVELRQGMGRRYFTLGVSVNLGNRSAER